MPLNLYGDKPIGAAKEVLGQQFETGKRFAGGLFSRGTAMGAYESKTAQSKAKIGEAIDAWGTDMLVSWKEKSGELNQALRQDLKGQREKANQARIQGDMGMYKLALQQLMFDKEMLAYANALDSARIGDIFTSIVAGLGQLGAGYFTSDSWYNFLNQQQAPKAPVAPPYGGGWQ